MIVLLAPSAALYFMLCYRKSVAHFSLFFHLLSHIWSLDISIYFCPNSYIVSFYSFWQGKICMRQNLFMWIWFITQPHSINLSKAKLSEAVWMKWISLCSKFRICATIQCPYFPRWSFLWLFFNVVNIAKRIRTENSNFANFFEVLPKKCKLAFVMFCHAHEEKIYKQSHLHYF